MRQVVLDTETTGIGYEKGHRIIEIGCVELFDRKFTGNHFHEYINPERAIDDGAFQVHGISSDFLKNKPLFKDILEPLICFIDGAELIIHNAPFDVGFLNTEFKRAKHKKYIQDHCRVLDTLVLAKQKHPGQRNNLDALCKRYEVSNHHRELHGALLDAELLAWVYLAMTGGQSELLVEDEFANEEIQFAYEKNPALLMSHTAIITADPQEIANHDAFIEYLVKNSGVNYWLPEPELEEV